jgi:hypothetical protein
MRPVQSEINKAGASMTPPAFFVSGLRAQVAGHEFAGCEESAMLRW